MSARWELDLIRVDGHDPLGLRVHWCATRDPESLRVVAVANASGDVIDRQAVDCDSAGTTGRPELDELVSRKTRALIAYARTVSEVARWDVQRERRSRGAYL